LGVLAVALLGGVAIWSQMPHELPAADKVDLGGAEVRLPLQLFGQRPLVEVKINGRGPYLFILDSAAMGTVIDERLASELGLQTAGRASATSPGGAKVTARMVRVDEMAMGTAVISGATLVAVDLSLMGKDGPRGAIGFSLIPHTVITVDYQKSEIVIRSGELPAADGKSILQYGFTEGLPTVTLDVAGTAVRAHLDSGSGGTFLLPAEFASRLPLDAAPVEAKSVHRVGKNIQVTTARLRGALRLGQYSFADPQLNFGQSLPIGNIGSEFLRQFVVSYDRSSRRVRLVRTPLSSSGP